MFDDLRRAAARQRQAQESRRIKAAAKRLLSEKGKLGGMTVVGELIERLASTYDDELDGFLDYLADELSPEPRAVLSAASAYAASPTASTPWR